MPTSLDEHGHDTELARLLHARGLVDVATLQRALEATRREREKGGLTLARALVHHGVLSEGEIAARLGELGKTTRKTSGDRLAMSLGSGSHYVAAPAEPKNAADTAGGIPGSSSGEATPVWKKGMRIGELRLIDVLGKGGMGVVFLAENVKTKARYAVKTILENAPPELVERLKREGEAQASVDAHPNVVRVHALGSAFGRLYLVMDEVTGGTLDQRIKKGALAPAEAARIVRDLARGLDYMHGKGVLHRDLKPANVMFDELGTPKLVDFGLALVGSATRLTLSGELLGTPAYMAPEQALGQRDRLGPWTDVYGLGGILYSALTGYAPFTGDTSVQVVESLLKDPVVPLRSRREGISPTLEAICLGALAKDPKDRPKPGPFADSLDAWLEGTAAPRARPVSRVTKTLVGVALASVVGLAIFLALPRSGANAPPTPAAAPAPLPRPAPVPARPAAVWLDWKWTQPLRFSLQVNGTVVWQGIDFVIAKKYTLAWDAAETEPHKLTVTSRIDALQARNRIGNEEEVAPQFGMFATAYRIDFDSERPGEPSCAYSQVVGKSFDFDLDARSGHITAARGVAAINALLQSHVEDERRRGRYFAGEISSEASLMATLDALLNVTGDEGGFAGGHWALKRREPVVTMFQAFRHLAARQAAEVPSREPIEVLVRVDSLEETGARASFKWAGSNKTEGGRERKVSGTASFQGGHIVRSEATEDLTNPEWQAHFVFKLEELPPK